MIRFLLLPLLALLLSGQVSAFDTERYFPLSEGRALYFINTDHPEWYTVMITSEIVRDERGADFNFWILKNDVNTYWGDVDDPDGPQQVQLVCRMDRNGLSMLGDYRYSLDYSTLHSWTTFHTVATGGTEPVSDTLHLCGFPVYCFIPAGFLTLTPYLEDNPFRWHCEQAVELGSPGCDAPCWIHNDWTMVMGYERLDVPYMAAIPCLKVQYLEICTGWEGYPEAKPAELGTERINETWWFGDGAGPVKVLKFYERLVDGEWITANDMPVKNIELVYIQEGIQ